MRRSICGVLVRLGIVLAVLSVGGCEDGGDGSLGDGHDFGQNDPNLYVAMGDSITYGYGGSTSYPAELSAMLGSRVVNQGVPGAVSAEGASRVDSVLRRYRPGYLLILYGANDVIHLDTGGTINNLRSMVYAARANQTIPVVATLTPMYYSHAVFAGSVQALNARVRAMARQDGVPLVDLESVFGGNRSYMQLDGLHPNDAGYRLMAQAFYDVLR